MTQPLRKMVGHRLLKAKDDPTIQIALALLGI